MKKIIPCALALIVTLGVASGCSPSPLHKDVYKEWQAFKSDQAYTQFFDGNIEFTDEIQSAKMSITNKYHTITYCESLISYSLQNANTIFGVFNLVPDYHQNSIRKLCGRVLDNLENFKAEVADFNEEKARLERQVELLGIDSHGAQAELKDFLLDIGNLTISANNLQVSFTNAFATLYSLPIDREIPGGETDVLASISTVQSLLIDDCVRYSITKNAGVHPDEKTIMFDAVNTLTEQMRNFTPKTENYLTWVEAYRLFKAEDDMFKNSLNHVDLMKDNSNLVGNAKKHFQKVQNFVTDNANIFVTKTISLLY